MLTLLSFLLLNPCPPPADPTPSWQIEQREYLWAQVCLNWKFQHYLNHRGTCAVEPYARQYWAALRRETERRNEIYLRFHNLASYAANPEVSQEIIRKLQLLYNDDEVLFSGYVPDPIPREYLSESEFVAFLRWYEAHPMGEIDP